MLDQIRAVITADATTSRFLLGYLACLLALYAAGSVHAALAPGRQPPAERAAPPRPGIQQSAGAGAVAFVRWLASLNITPNQITVIGLVLVVFNCAYFIYHGNAFAFGFGLIVSYLFDMLDGLVARTQGSATKFGAYLDAVVDRYQEIATFLAIGVVTELWLPAFLVITGSMLTSYNKARAAMEVPVDNKAWPDLLEKGSRQTILCVALIGAANLPWLLPAALWLLAITTYFTALQRIVRSHFLIREQPRRSLGRF